MIHRVIGTFIIIASCLGIGFAIWHLAGMLKVPKDKRLWWGTDIVIQLFFYPICLLGIILGIYQFMI